MRHNSGIQHRRAVKFLMELHLLSPNTHYKNLPHNQKYTRIVTIIVNGMRLINYRLSLLVQSFYEKKGVNLKLIATQMVSTVSNTEKFAL